MDVSRVGNPSSNLGLPAVAPPRSPGATARGRTGSVATPGSPADSRQRVRGGASSGQPGAGAGGAQTALVNINSRMNDVNKALGQLSASLSALGDGGPSARAEVGIKEEGVKAAPPGPAIRQVVASIVPPATPPGGAFKQAPPGPEIHGRIINVIKEVKV